MGDEIEYTTPQEGSSVWGVKVKLTRGQKGTYGWEISVFEPGRKDEELLERLSYIDVQLREVYETI